jgi:hypothetical protein
MTKYECFWPDIANKQCNPSNIIVEINKKCLKMAVEGTCSYLRHCIVKEEFGRKISLIVRDKCLNNKMEIVFLKLSDGWTSVWAVV